MNMYYLLCVPCLVMIGLCCSFMVVNFFNICAGHVAHLFSRGTNVEQHGMWADPFGNIYYIMKERDTVYGEAVCRVYKNGALLTACLSRNQWISFFKSRHLFRHGRSI
jgi:hypothetical protein